MKDIRINLPTLLLLLAVSAGAAFAAGSALPVSTTVSKAAAQVAIEPPSEAEHEQESLPPGHPPVNDPPSDQPGEFENAGETPDRHEASVEWKAPLRWQLVPSTSTMRLATYRVPRVAGDPADAELAITRAGGSTDANAERWIHQFDEAGQQTAKRTLRAVGLAEVPIIEVHGAYSGAMGNDRSPQPGWALIGAIVSSPGQPYFFKLTGPAKSVLAARSEFDALVGSLSLRLDGGR